MVGSKLVARLRELGRDAVAASPASGVNTLTGEGLAEVLEGASVVVDVSNSPSFEDAAALNFFQTSTTNMLAAEAAAGVGHHVALSVVGTDRLTESGYFRAKIAQETLIKASPISYSIVPSSTTKVSNVFFGLKPCSGPLCAAGLSGSGSALVSAGTSGPLAGGADFVGVTRKLTFKC